MTQDYISLGDLRGTLRLLGEDLSDEELMDMVKASTGHPGEDEVPHITYNDFMKLVPPLCPSHVFQASTAARHSRFPLSWTTRPFGRSGAWHLYFGTSCNSPRFPSLSSRQDFRRPAVP